MIKKAAFVGIGVMGGPMVGHLLDAGYDVTIYQRDAAKAAPLLEKGAKAVTALRDVAKDADVVFTMLPTEATVHEVLLGPGGVMEGARPGILVANTSTVSPESNLRLGAELKAKGFRFLDSPVTGSGLQAQAGTLVFIAGGDRADYEEAAPLYEAMGSGSYYAGATGAGSYAKIASNLMMAVNMISFAEALTMAVKAGVDPEMFVKFTAGGGPQSAMADKKIGKIVKRDFSPAFRTALMHKDTWLAANVARELRLPTPMLNLAKEMFGISIAEGYSDEDICAVVKCYERWADLNNS